MVVGLVDEREVDKLFRALADATRRDILRTAMAGTPSVSELAARYAMSFAAVQRHVAVLASVGLVRKQQHGREQLVSTQMSTITNARVVLDAFESLWRSRLDRFEDVLGSTATDTPAPDRPAAT